MNQKIDVLNRDFPEARARLLDLAAFLDRVERAEGTADFRWEALQQTLPLLLEQGSERTRHILELLSWPGDTPMTCPKGNTACGAAPRTSNPCSLQ